MLYNCGHAPSTLSRRQDTVTSTFNSEDTGRTTGAQAGEVLTLIYSRGHTSRTSHNRSGIPIPVRYLEEQNYNIFRSKIPIPSRFLEGKEIADKSSKFGVITQIPHELYDLLNELQDKLSHVIKPVGKIEHSFWRAFNTEVKTEACEGFIDGDLIENFLDLPRKEMIEVINGIQVNNGSGMKQEATIDDIIKIIEDLTRVH